MMGRQGSDQRQLFYLFNLEDCIPTDHLLRRINPIVAQVLADLREKLASFYSDIGRPSVDPELMLRMLMLGYCYGIRSERRLCEEVKLHLAYRWFCKLDLDDTVPHHSTFSVNRLGRFRESDILRHVFERVVAACMAAGLVTGDSFAVDARSSGRMPAVIMARRRTSWIGPMSSASDVRWPSIWRRSMPRPPHRWPVSQDSNVVAALPGAATSHLPRC
jgi:transposase